MLLAMIFKQPSEMALLLSHQKDYRNKKDVLKDEPRKHLITLAYYNQSNI